MRSGGGGAGGELSLSSPNLMNTWGSLLVLASNPVPPRPYSPTATFASSLPAPSPLAVSLPQQSPSSSAPGDLYTLNQKPRRRGPSLPVRAGWGAPTKGAAVSLGAFRSAPGLAGTASNHVSSSDFSRHSSHTLTATSWHLYLNPFPVDPENNHRWHLWLQRSPWDNWWMIVLTSPPKFALKYLTSITYFRIALAYQ